jgi:ribonuclease HII
MPSFRIDGARLIAGVDEAGRGPLAGPVAAAAVLLRSGPPPIGVADSKTLTEARREAAFARILEEALAVSFVLLPPAEIDRLNIRGATLVAMRRAVEGLSVKPDLALIDGRDIPRGLPCPARAIIGGDATEPAISAASIVAKVMRDRLMARLGSEDGRYGFAGHKGYPSAAHRAAVAAHGASPHHRLSYAPFKNDTG